MVAESASFIQPCILPYPGSLGVSLQWVVAESGSLILPRIDARKSGGRPRPMFNVPSRVRGGCEGVRKSGGCPTHIFNVPSDARGTTRKNDWKPEAQLQHAIRCTRRMPEDARKVINPRSPFVTRHPMRATQARRCMQKRWMPEARASRYACMRTPSFGFVGA